MNVRNNRKPYFDSMEISNIPVDVRLRRIEPVAPLFYKNVPVNAPIPTLKPASSLIPPMSSAPDPILENVSNVRKRLENRPVENDIESLVVRDVLDHSASLRGIDSAQGGSPVLKVGLIALGLFIFWDSLKKL
jgi:hypothetical protein